MTLVGKEIVSGFSAIESPTDSPIFSAPPPPLRPRDRMDARFLFGAQEDAAFLPAQSHGGYTKGCLAGGEALEVSGRGWDVMRVSRNRYWGHPRLLSFIRDLARRAREEDGWSGLLVGDLSQPRGGPMLSDHASHQIGLDVDIWLTPAPDRVLTLEDREEMKPVRVVRDRYSMDMDVWTVGHMRLLRRAASYDGVARLFVHPPIKRALCDWAVSEGLGASDWLGKIRPWYGHDSHFHVRLKCVAGESSCIDQAAPPGGSGCGSALDWWFTPTPWERRRLARERWEKERRSASRAVMTLSDLPRACRGVLNAASKKE